MNLRGGYYREMDHHETQQLRWRAEPHGYITSNIFYGGGYTHECGDCSSCATGDTTLRCPVCDTDVTEETRYMSSRSPFACSCGSVIFVCATSPSNHGVGIITSFIPAIKDLSIEEDAI